MPDVMKQPLRNYLRSNPQQPTCLRVESNRWLEVQCRDIAGDILSIGSGGDDDGEGRKYRDYFPMALTYTTSEIEKNDYCNLVLDVRSMPQIGRDV